MEQDTMRAATRAALIAGALALTAAGAAAQVAPAPSTAGTPAPRPRPGAVYVRGAAPVTADVVPNGWLGIHYVCEIETWTKNRELFVKHNGYPLVASVEPGSPAHRAGIEAGDTIIAYNGDDINGRVLSLTKLLKPGSKLDVRIRRMKETFDIPVTVARRTMYAPDVAVIAPNVFVEVDSVTGLAHRMTVRSSARGGAVPAVVMVDPATPTPAIAPRAPMPPMSITWSTTTALAGAELVRVSPDLGESFGVERGVLVLSVGANTPAARAGLKGGDVITRVDGQDVTTPSQFQRALQRGEGGVKMTVVRKKKEIGVSLKW
jgi:S1-C subfamily serine protease